VSAIYNSFLAKWTFFRLVFHFAAHFSSVSFLLLFSPLHDVVVPKWIVKVPTQSFFYIYILLHNIKQSNWKKFIFTSYTINLFIISFLSLTLNLNTHTHIVIYIDIVKLERIAITAKVTTFKCALMLKRIQYLCVNELRLQSQCENKRPFLTHFS
jgi:hypothetical protein